jgi:hypothetical protein
MRWKDHLDRVGVVGSLIAVACCLGLAVLLSVVTASGLGLLIKDTILIPLMIVFLGLILVGLFLGYTVHLRPWALILAGISSVAVVFFHFIHTVRLAADLAIAGLEVASVFNVVLRRKCADAKTHWEKIYTSKASDQFSWYRPHLETSLALIARASRGYSASIFDIGGGESTLVDDLLARGFRNIAVLDISEKAIKATRKRLGHAAEQVHWLAADITQAELEPNSYDVWPDRAVFHFLTDAQHAPLTCCKQPAPLTCCKQPAHLNFANISTCWRV